MEKLAEIAEKRVPVSSFSKDELWGLLEEQNQWFIQKHARRMVNLLYELEDAKQEIALRVMNFLEKSPEYLDLDVVNLGYVVRKVIMDFVTDKIRFCSRRSDTSIYKPEEINDEMFLSNIKPTHFEAEENDYISLIHKKLAVMEERYPGVTAFFREAINPSLETLDKYEVYKESLSRRRFMADDHAHKSIPPNVLAKLVDVSPRRLLTFQLVIGRILASLGIKQASDFYFNQTGIRVTETKPDTKSDACVVEIAAKLN